MARRRLPIGIQTFRTLREEGCYYVDKTPYLERLLGEGARYFLSRPRRFGKSLFLDTLKEFFEGNESLFEGLYIHGRHDWSKRHPVVRLSFGGGTFKDLASLNDDAMAQLDGLARDQGVPVRYDTAPARFRDLLQAVHEKSRTNAWQCSWTSTTSRSWTRWRRPTRRAPTATTCAASTG